MLDTDDIVDPKLILVLIALTALIEALKCFTKCRGRNVEQIVMNEI